MSDTVTVITLPSGNVAVIVPVVAGGNCHLGPYSDRGVATLQRDNRICRGLYCKLHLPGSSQRPGTIGGIPAGAAKGCRPQAEYFIVDAEAPGQIGNRARTKAVQLKGLLDYVLSTVCCDCLRSGATWILTDAARPGQVVIRLSTKREAARPGVGAGSDVITEQLPILQLRIACSRTANRKESSV